MLPTLAEIINAIAIEKQGVRSYAWQANSEAFCFVTEHPYK
jgi:hypothetical protein